MEGAIQNFSFESSNVRIIVEEGEPLFCASDVCKALGYANTPDALKKHCSEDGIAKRDTIDSLGRNQSTSFINERNLYRLVMRSKLPSAERFQDWVCGEVLPSIRKTGKYSAVQQLPQSYADALRQLAAEVEQREALQAKNLQLETKAKEDAPRVEMAKRAIESNGAWLIRVVAKVVNVPCSALFDFMRRTGILTAKNEPYAAFVKNGVIRPKLSTFTDSDGNEHTKITSYVTPRGIEYLIPRLIKDGLIKDRSCVQYELLENAQG